MQMSAADDQQSQHVSDPHNEERVDMEYEEDNGQEDVRAALHAMQLEMDILRQNSMPRFCLTMPDGTSITFPTAEALHAYRIQSNVPSSDKPITIGKAPKPYTGNDPDYLISDFLDAFNTYCSDKNTEATRVTLMHSYLQNPARKYVSQELAKRADTLSSISSAAYESLLNTFSLKPDPTTYQRVCDLFNTPLSSQVHDTWLIQFNQKLLKCPKLDLEVQISAYLYNLPRRYAQMLQKNAAGAPWPSLSDLQAAGKELIFRMRQQEKQLTPEHIDLTRSQRSKNKQKSVVSGKRKRNAALEASTSGATEVISRKCAFLFKQDVPKDVNGNIITLAKFLATKQANTCAFCLKYGHVVEDCRTRPNGETPECSTSYPVLPTYHFQRREASRLSAFWRNTRKAQQGRQAKLQEAEDRPAQQGCIEHHACSVQLNTQSALTSDQPLLVHTVANDCQQPESGPVHSVESVQPCPECAYPVVSNQPSNQLLPEIVTELPVLLDGSTLEPCENSPGVVHTCNQHAQLPASIPCAPLALASDSAPDEELDTQDRMLLPTYFKFLQTKAGLNCTVDAFANPDGGNSHCNLYRHKDNSAFDTAYTKDIVFANPAYEKCFAFTTHFIACHLRSKYMGGILLLPDQEATKAAINLAERFLRPLHTFPPNTVLFTAPHADGSRNTCGPCPWAVRVYHAQPGSPIVPRLAKKDKALHNNLRYIKSARFPNTAHTVKSQPTSAPDNLLMDQQGEAMYMEVPPEPSVPVPPTTVNTESPYPPGLPHISDPTLLFRFPVTVSGIKLNATTDWDHASHPNLAFKKVFLDTGAAIESLVSAQLCAQVNAKVKPIPKHLNLHLALATGAVSNVKGFTHLNMTVGNMKTRVHAFVVDNPEAEAADILLGQPWLRRHKVILDYGKQQVTAFRGNTKHTLTPEHSLPPFPRPQRCKLSKTIPKLCSVRAVHKALNNGQKVWLAIVKEAKVVTAHDVTDSEQVRQLLDEYKDIWPMDFNHLPVFRPELPPVIPLIQGAQPVCRNRGRYTQPEREEIQRQIEHFLAVGRIRPSSSPWGAPVLFVPKKSGRGLRMCIDYRPLNQQTVKNRYPLPRIDDLLDQLSGARYFSSIDLLHGYHQVRLSEEEVPCTAFTTPFGSYEFLVMPFGLTNAPAVFQGFMNELFRPLLYKHVLVYLDDILVYSKTMDEHVHHLRQVFDILRKNKVYMCLEKSHFLRDAIPYLGHIITPDGIKVDPTKVTAVEEMPRPTNVKETQSFLGFINYFRRFLPRLSLVLKPLTDLTRKGVPFIWSDEADAAFHSAKQMLLNTAVLSTPDFTKPFEMVTDASDHHVGGILCQGGRPICFESRLLNPTEQRWPTHDKELYSLVWCCTKWRPYVDGQEVVCYTDHSPLQFVQTQHNLNAKQVRWLQFLQGLRPSIVYRPGLGNPADALTRLCKDRISREHSMMPRAGTFAVASCLTAYSLNASPVQQKVSKRDDVSGKLLLAPVQPALFAENYKLEHDGFYAKSSDHLAKHHILPDNDGLFWFVQGDARRLCVPSSLITHVLHYCHDDPFVGHMGYHKTLSLATSKYWWRNMRNDIAQYCRLCTQCQALKVTPYHHPLHPLPIPDGPFQSVSMDFITHLPLTARYHDALLVLVDRFSKYCILLPCQETISAEDTAQLIFDRVLPMFGTPKNFVSDRDSKFTSDFFKSWCKLIGAAQHMSSGHHPQTDGQTERMNRTIQQVMRFYVLPNQTNWDLLVPTVQFALNSHYNQATKASAFQIVLGYNPASPFDRLLNFTPETRKPDWRVQRATEVQQARQALHIAQQRMMQQDLGNIKTFTLKVGEHAWLSTKHLKLQTTGISKLMPRYVGPFKVVTVINDVTYKLDLPPNMKLHPVFHVSELKPVPSGTKLPNQPIAVEIDGNVEFLVDSILAHKVRQRRTQNKHTAWYVYLTSFEGMDAAQNEWLTEDDFTCDGTIINTVLQAYKREHNLTSPLEDAQHGKLDLDLPRSKRAKRSRVQH